MPRWISNPVGPSLAKGSWTDVVGKCGLVA